MWSMRVSLASCRPPGAAAQADAGYLDAAAPYRAAELYAVDDIIDPRQTRQFLISALQGAQRKIQRQLHRKHSIGRRRRHEQEKAQNNQVSR